VFLLNLNNFVASIPADWMGLDGADLQAKE
jgi:hypothetical protein